jgi:alkylated DNA repair protein alkB family protein 6
MTSIDFKRLLAEERKKIRNSNGSSASASTQRLSSPPPASSASPSPSPPPSSAQLPSDPAPTTTLPPLSLRTFDNPIDLMQYKVGTIDSCYYIPDFITKEEEDLLVLHIYTCSSKWTQLKRRRLQNWGGIPNPKGMVQEPLPPFLATISEKLVTTNVFHVAPNHVLLNEYLAGQGIMSHKDGPLYYPKVAILSLSGPAMIDFRPDLRAPPSMSLLLQPRSLFIFTDEAYKSYFHGIEEREQDTVTNVVANAMAAVVSVGDQVERGTRLSLTIRIVPNTIQPSDVPATQEAAEEARRMENFWYSAINERY